MASAEIYRKCRGSNLRASGSVKSPHGICLADGYEAVDSRNPPNGSDETVLHRGVGDVTLARPIIEKDDEDGSAMRGNGALRAGGQRVRSSHEPLIQKEERA